MSNILAGTIIVLCVVFLLLMTPLAPIVILLGIALVFSFGTLCAVAALYAATHRNKS